MKFSDIIGQEAVKERLRNTVSENRISHAQLFLGPEGSGKLALAIAYAQYINCRNRTPFDSCGVCPSCKKYGKLIHPDLHFIYPINRTKEVDELKIYSTDFVIPWREFFLENKGYLRLPDWYQMIGIEKKQGYINAEDADSINRTLGYKAYEAEYKVMIIWMVEKMNIPAANKLLKNLEEPPDKTLFILIAEDQDQIISTILSRTQLVKIPPLMDEDIISALVLKMNVSVDDAKRIALLADGNYAAASRMTSGTVEESDFLLAEKQQFERFRDWMRKCYTTVKDWKDYDKLLEFIPQLQDDGSRERQKEFLIYCLQMFRICLQYNVGNYQLVRLDGEELEFIQKFSRFIHPGNVQYLDEEFNKAIFHIERNANANIVFTDLSHLIAGILNIPAVSQAKKV